MITDAEKIRNKRLKLNMTQKELADSIGLSKYGDRSIRRWESGECKPSLLALKAILAFPEEAPFKNKGDEKYTMIDLFAGIGGTRLGFVMTNEVASIFSSEWDKFACKTYKANFGEEPQGDITKIKSELIPDHNILVGGFPCVAFSQAGKKNGFKDERGRLFFEIVRIIKDKMPDCFLLENVKNLISHDGGKTFKVVVSELENLNYSIFYKVFSAKDFGVPQKRERVYIVGFNNKTVRAKKSFNFPKPSYVKTSVGDVLETEIDSKYTLSDKLWEGHKRRKVENKKKGKGFGYSIFNENSEYTNTISARYYKDGSEILIEQEGKNPRKITPREAARLQGFPDNYIIPVSDTQAYKQFGNSVAVPVVASIATRIVEYLDENLI